MKKTISLLLASIILLINTTSFSASNIVSDMSDSDILTISGHCEEALESLGKATNEASNALNAKDSFDNYNFFNNIDSAIKSFSSAYDTSAKYPSNMKLTNVISNIITEIEKISSTNLKGKSKYTQYASFTEFAENSTPYLEEMTSIILSFSDANPNDKTTFPSKTEDASTFIIMYAPDGRSEMVSCKDVEAWKNVGWYTYPVMNIFAKDGRSIVIDKSALNEWLAVGWFAEPFVDMYAPDGRNEKVLSSQVSAWEAVGWINGDRIITIYAPDGRTMNITYKQLPAYKNVGWYDYPVINIFNSNGSSKVIPQSDLSTWQSKGWKTSLNSSESDKLKFANLIKSGMDNLTSATSNLTKYIKNSSIDSYLASFYLYIRWANDNFKDAYMMTLQYDDLKPMSTNLKNINDIIDEIIAKKHSPTAIPLDSILAQLKNVLNYINQYF